MGKPVKVTDKNKAWNRTPQGRQVDVRPMRRRFLIVTDGTETEPVFFEALRKRATIGVVQVELCGTGRSTLSLIKVIAGIRADKESELGIHFDEVWAVFDKDSFKREDFDNAIHSCEAHGYGAAWSNECFEIWYLLHFNDRQTGIGRDEIFSKLEEQFGISNYRDLKGHQGRSIHEMMAGHSNQEQAIKRAKRLYHEMSPTGRNPIDPPSHQNPCTAIFKLVEKLLVYCPRVADDLTVVVETHRKTYRRER